jgi:hypothetical protein
MLRTMTPPVAATAIAPLQRCIFHLLALPLCRKLIHDECMVGGEIIIPR